MTTEIWKPVTGYETLYEVSNAGRIRALFFAARGRWKPGRILKPKLTERGYPVVNLYKNGKLHSRTVHRIVLEAFVGLRPKGKEARHLDGVKINSKLSNLKWGTNAENMEDKCRHGNILHGEKHPNSKLKTEDVLAIRELIDHGMPLAGVAEQFHIGNMTAWKIGKRRNWRLLPEAA